MDNNHFNKDNSFRHNQTVSSRKAILDRLKCKTNGGNATKETEKPSDFSLYEMKKWTQDEKIARFVQQLSASHAEIFNTHSEVELKDVLNQVLVNKKIGQLLISERTQTLISRNDESKLDNMKGTNLQLVNYQSIMENKSSWQEELFNSVDASITTSVSSVAETGSIILIPDSVEPRLMSLVPPIHIVIVEKEKMLNTFYEVILQQQWEQGIRPTNLVMISGPSKTADIEQTLSYGVHGPKELIVILK